jgi:lipopolysaccharide/colanic/teichoic acid biosynthesis glycosyltransferase
MGFTGAILNRDADPPHFDRYYNERARRHNVLLGITGWSQINGRNAITWNQKFESDVWYVDHRSLWLDIKILWLTAMTIIHREGISQTGQVTQELLNA